MGNNEDIRDLIKSFKFEGEFINAETHVSGHINDTFIANFKNEDGSITKYIIQRINHNIFKQPDKLMENIAKVCDHVKGKVEEEKGDVLRECLNIVQTVDNENFVKTSTGDYWRAFLFIHGASTYMKVEKPEHMYYAGKAFGKFQKQLADFPVNELHDTIPDFHHTAKRYETFTNSVVKDASKRAASVTAEIEFLKSREEDCKRLVNMIERNELPLRVTHNDTKFNNVMLDDATGEGICVIDLDTVMPGLSLYDFGDSIRSGATTALEDETDLSKVNFDIELFEQYTKGFLEETKDSLTENEINNLAFSAKLITMEIGMRFLTDHLDGDVYFKIHRENHNLDRARNQFKLVADMEKRMDEMNEIVRKYAK